MMATMSRRTAMSKTNRKSVKVPAAGRFAYDGLDRVFHEKARLGIMTSLSRQPDGLSFSDLKTVCALSDGNLNRHLSVLQDAGFVKTKKEGSGRSSLTLCVITRAGQSAFHEYLQELERVLADAAQAATMHAKSSRPLRPGWSTS
jgi:DNA-binding transcriptional ArsR family regulator